MPSPGEDIQSWSVTAANNGTADPLIVWSEGQARASVNNSSRSEMAAHAKNRNLLNGSIVTTGSANAQAFVSGVSYTAIPTGLVVKLKIGSGLTNTGSATLNMDGIGDTLIKTADGNNLLGSELIANAYTDLLYNGTNWIFLYSREFVMDRLDGGGIIIGKQVFGTPGTFTYTPTAGMECGIAECVGGGGGSGGASAGVGDFMGGGGGGGGAYARKYFTAADIGASQTVTVGAGGVGSAGGGSGGGGGTSSLGALCVAPGGGGGIDATLGIIPPGGVGGGGGTGDVLCTGGAGGPGFYHNGYTTQAFSFPGSGGNSVLGGGGRGSNVNQGSGLVGGNYGGGGGGSNSWNGGGVAVGAAGGPGAVIITEFAGRGAPGRDGATGATGAIGPPGPAGAGTGDVLRSGTPTAGQMAQWVDAAHIKGVDVAATFTTGDAKLTLKTVADTGWVLMNDGTIGSATSGASTRANADCQDLFLLLWNNVVNAWAPVVGGRGASAAADWAANKQITLTRQLGRSISIAGTGAGLSARPLGAFVGEESHTVTLAEMPAHTHTASTPSPYPIFYSTVAVDVGSTVLALATPNAAYYSSGVTINSAGSGTAMNVVQPTSFWNIMIKL